MFPVAVADMMYSIDRVAAYTAQLVYAWHEFQGCKESGK